MPSVARLKETKMKKNETTEVEEKKLVWKMKELPTADSIGKLVDTKVITPEEARSILFKEEVQESDEVVALKEMVNTLQEMVKDLISRQSIQYVPYTKVVEVPRRYNPYWEKYWMSSSSSLDKTVGDNGRHGTMYTLSIG